MTLWKSEIQGIDFEVDWSEPDQRVSVRHPVWTKGSWMLDARDVDPRPRNESDATERAWEFLRELKKRTRSYRRLIEEIHRGQGKSTVDDLSRALNDMGALPLVAAVSVLVRARIIRMNGPVGPELTFEPIHGRLEDSIEAARARELGLDEAI